MITLHIPAERRQHLIQAAWRVNRRVFLVYWAVGAIATVCGVLLLIDTWQVRHTLKPFDFTLLVIGLVQFLIPSFGVLRYRWRLAKLRMEPCTITINEERVFVQSPSANGDFAWQLISSVLESRDSFIVRQGRLVRVVLPKAEFIGDDLPAFRRLLVSRSLARP